MSLGPIGKIGDLDAWCIGFKRIPDRPMYALHFGATLSSMQIIRQDAEAFANFLQVQILNDFGPLAYDKSTLPIQVECDLTNNMLNVRLPQPVEILAANPEVWLALADEIKVKLRQLPPLN